MLDPKRFYLDFLPYRLRKVRRDGIRLFNIHYRDIALEALAGRSEQKYVVKYDPGDLSCVYLKVALGEYVRIPYRDLSRPPITLSEQKWATRELRKQGRLAVHEYNLFASIEAQRRLIEQATHETQSTRRTAEKKRLAMKALSGAKDRQGAKSPSRPLNEVEPIGPVKPYPFEVWDDH